MGFNYRSLPLVVLRLAHEEAGFAVESLTLNSALSLTVVPGFS